MGQIYIEDKPYGIKEALKIIGVEHSLIPKRRERIFEPPQELLRKDTLNGGYKYPKRTGVMPQFSVFSPQFDREVTVRYATSSRPIVQNGVSTMSYQPIQLFINGEAELVNEDVEFLFRYLHPSCKQSPLRKGSQPYSYVYRNSEADAAQELEKEELRIRALSMIIGDNAKPISELRRLLKGFGEGNVDQMEEATVRKRLKDQAYADPDKFLITVSGKDFQFKAMVRDALDKNIFTINQEDGLHKFYYEGAEVHSVPANLDAFGQLFSHVAENLHKYYQPIQDKLAGHTLDAILDRPEYDKYFQTKEEIIPDISQAEAGREVNKVLTKEQYAMERKAKIAYWASLDENDPNLHPSTKKAIERNREEIEEYRQSLKT